MAHRYSGEAPPLAATKRAALCLSILLAAGRLHAQTPALDFSSLGTCFDYSQGTYSLGWSFSTTQNVSVSALGFYDDLKNGLSASHDVGIYNASNCALLAATTVTPSDPLTGFFRYHNIAPVTLPAGGQYLIAAVTGTEKYAVSVTSLTVHPSVTFRKILASRPPVPPRPEFSALIKSSVQRSTPSGGSLHTVATIFECTRASNRNHHAQSAESALS